jgi:hypothetical protein
MRAADFILEEYAHEDDVVRETESILLRAKEAEVPEISVERLLDYLLELQLSASVDSLSNLLMQIPFAQLEGDRISLSTGDEDENMGTTYDNDPDNNKEVVSDLARKAAERSMNDRQQAVN